MINLKLNLILSEATSVRDAVEKSGLTHLQLYKYLKNLGIDMHLPHLWFSQLRPSDPSIESDLESTFQ